MRLKAAVIGAALVFALCGCGSYNSMDIEFLQEEAYQKGYEQGQKDAKELFGAEGDYDSGYGDGYEEGYAAGYSEGKASTEDYPKTEGEKTSEAEASAGEQEFDYVLNKNSKKFHKPDCSSVGDIKEKNKEYFTGTRETLTEKGYEPCGRCEP